MSVSCVSTAKITIKSDDMVKFFQKYGDTLIHYKEGMDFHSKMQIEGDVVSLTVFEIDAMFDCPQGLDEVINTLIMTLGDDEIADALEDEEYPQDLAEDYGDFAFAAAELMRHSKKMIASISSLQWEVEYENTFEDEDGETRSATFTYDRNNGERYVSSDEE